MLIDLHSWGVHRVSENIVLVFQNHESAFLKFDKADVMIEFLNIQSLKLFFSWCCRHQVSHFLPETWIMCRSTPSVLWPPDGGALVDEMLQSRREVSVSLRPHVAQLDQDHGHFTLDQRVMEPNLGNKNGRSSLMFLSLEE